MNRLCQSLLTLVIASLGVTMLPGAASAEPGACAPTQSVDPLRLLRQASLDLRGSIPTFDEYQAVKSADDPAAEVDARIDGMLVSDAYFDNVREYHRNLMWSSMDDAVVDRVLHPGRRLTRTNNTELWRVPAAGRWFRGANNVTCLNQEQTEFDAQGRPIPIQTYADINCNGPGAGGVCSREGYVMVEPYWAPGTEVKVCAFDAQAFELGASGDACAAYHPNDAGCGCGPNLQWCGRVQDEYKDDFRDVLAEEPLRIFENVVRADLPYVEAFTTDLTWMNGTLTHYYRHLVGMLNQNQGGAAYDTAMGELPDLAYGEDDVWVPVDREGAHAGVLTTYGFLGRFASNRGRANRFFTAFYCAPFVPPEDGLPPQEEDPDPNLRVRNGCDGCHAELEPAAAHWGRWRTGGTYGLLRPELLSFEAPDELCLCGEGTDRPNCNLTCRSYYVTADNSHPDEYELYGGLPLTTAWADPTELHNADVGPDLLVETPEQKRQIAQCMVRTMAEHLLARELDEDDLPWVVEHTDALEADGYRFAGMVSRMVADDRYRSIH